MNEAIYNDIPLNQIRPGKFQPRREFDAIKLLDLAISIEEHGLLNAVIVSLNGEGVYELDAGERRWRASCAIAIAPTLTEGLAEAVGFTSLENWPDIVARGDWSILGAYTIRASEQPADLDLETRHEIAVIDNLQREDLNPIEEAEALYELKEARSYSLRQLAQKVGRSKSYVDDRLKLRELTPDVAARVAAEDEPLDLGIAREIARKIPADLQAPLVAEIQKLNGVEAKDLIKFIGQAAKFIEINRYNLSDDFNTPYRVEWYNRARLLRHLLENAPPERLAGALVELTDLKPGNYHNYLTSNITSLIEGGWRFVGVTKKLAGLKSTNGYSSNDSIWETIATQEGWTCESCALRNIAPGLENRVDEFNYGAPCRKLKRFQAEDEITTCLGYVGPDDPQVIETTHLARWLDESSYNKMLKTPLRGTDGGSYVETWTDYHHLYITARQEMERMGAEKAEAEKSAHLAPMRAYWESQGEGTIFALDNFQAHACRKCVHFLEPSDRFQADIPCAFAAKPLTQNKVPRPPVYRIWISEAGVVVPRCEKFQYRELPPIQRQLKGSFTIGSRELILEWYRLLAGGKPPYQAQERGIFAPLSWLPGSKNLLKVWDQIEDDDIMMIILNMGIQERVACEGWTAQFKLSDPTGAVDIEWRPVGWATFAERRDRLYNWPEDWVWPFGAGDGERQMADDGPKVMSDEDELRELEALEEEYNK